MELLKVILLLSFFHSLVHFSVGNGTLSKLREYKICKEGRCNSLRSFPSAAYMNKLLFSFSGWNDWSQCNDECTTYRSRVCRFPFLCGSTIVHEEAFCFHRGSVCEHLYLRFLRDSGSNSDEDPMMDDPLENAEIQNQDDSLEYPLSTSQLSRRIDFSNKFSQRKPELNPSIANDESSFENIEISEVNGLSRETCGVARLTKRNRRGISMRILGGKETRKGRWPWQVAILNRHGETYCGGTLISPRWIVTAAHCVRRRIQVTIGEHHLHTDEGTEKHFRIETAFIHPNFNPETVDNDIALLLLPEPVVADAGVACLPNKNQGMPSSGTMCTILGWGKERYNHVFGTSILHEGRVPLVSNAECRLTYDTSELTNNMFCSGYRNGTVDSCAGDSGGPLLCKQDKRWVIFGVTSFGDGCGRVGKFGIYAKVPNYVNWIYKVINATENDNDNYY